MPLSARSDSQLSCNWLAAEYFLLTASESRNWSMGQRPVSGSKLDSPTIFFQYVPNYFSYLDNNEAGLRILLDRTRLSAGQLYEQEMPRLWKPHTIYIPGPVTGRAYLAYMLLWKPWNIFIRKWHISYRSLAEFEETVILV